MSLAPNTPTPSRRRLLAGSGLTAALAAVGFPVAASSAIPAPNPDAELIAVCAEFDVCQLRTDIIHGTGPDCVVDDDEANVASAPIFARMGELLELMEQLQAVTPAGIQARAHSLALHGDHGGYDFGASGTMVGDLLTYLMRDARALGALA